MEDSNHDPQRNPDGPKPSSPDFEALDASLDEGFDTIGFDYNPDDLEKTPASGTPIAAFRADPNSPFGNPFADAVPDGEDEEHTNVPPMGATTAQQLATIMAEFGFNVPEEEPDLERLQSGLIGIDLGSSDAVVACFNPDGKAIVVANSVDERTTPARLLRDEHGDWLIGREARSLAPSNPDFDFPDLKSLFLMGGWSTVIKDEPFTAGQLLATFVQKLLEDMGEDGIGFTPTHVALAAPVWFQEAHRASLAEALRQAGLDVVGVTDELLAACVPYSLRLPDLSPRKAAVVDVGHKGTSLAFVNCAGGDLEIICQAGLPDLGAANWDDLLIAESVRKFTKHHGFDPRIDPTCMTDLASRVDEAKKALSSRRYYIMPIQSEGKTLKVRFEREAFERASEGMLRKLRTFLSKVLEKSEINDWSELDALVVTGGGARMPMVKGAIEACVGRPAEPFNAEENVAIGTLYWGVAARHRAEKAAEQDES